MPLENFIKIFKKSSRITTKTPNILNDFQLLAPEDSAATVNVNRLFTYICLLCLTLAFGIVFFQRYIVIYSFLLLNLLYIIIFLPKVYYFLIGVQNVSHRHNTKLSLENIPKDTLPTYTILLPAFHEEVIVLQNLLLSLTQMDYPLEKLQVLMLLEENDPETKENLNQVQLDKNLNLQVLIVPKGIIQTKPRACNYGLQFATGEYLVIYDVEDHPEPDQLLKAVATFEQLKQNVDPEAHKVMCLQAELNYYNSHDNWLTKAFALEYGVWFDGMLRGLSLCNSLIPLGGTSNHFQTQVLRKLCAWDAYNVTEDADLGVRLIRHGYRVQFLPSFTWEEAPNKIKAWVKQRSRWIKGFLQTYTVHMRHPLLTKRQLGWKNFGNFQIFIGAPILVFVLVPIIAITHFFLYRFSPSLLQPYPQISFLITWNYYLTFSIMIWMNFIIVKRFHWHHMLLNVITMPFYYFLHTIAAFIAIYQFFSLPFYWQKTSHGHSVKQVPTFTNT